MTARQVEDNPILQQGMPFPIRTSVQAKVLVHPRGVSSCCQRAVFPKENCNASSDVKDVVGVSGSV
jgi:hypothetical protein